MNPYESSQVPSPAAESQQSPSLYYNSLWKVCETIFLEWEKRRWVWNAVLVSLLLSGHALLEQRSSELRINWGLFLYVVLILNLVHFGGPILEFLATWSLGRRVRWGQVLFVIGLTFYSLLIIGGYLGLWVLSHLDFCC